MTYFLANVRTDLPTSQGEAGVSRCLNCQFTSLFIEAGSKHNVKGSDAWNSLREIIRFLTRLLTVASQITLILNLSRSTGGPIFAMICFIDPIFKVMFTRDLRDKSGFCSTFEHDESSLAYLFIVCFGYIDNEDRNRMNALRALVGDKYRQDIISNNIGEWIIDGQFPNLL